MARDPSLAGQLRMFGTSPITATPEENGRAALGMLPVIGNVISAQDAYNSFGDLRKASKAGDAHEQRKAMAQMLMGVLGAMSPLPWGKTAGMASREAKDTAFAFPAWHGSPHDFDAQPRTGGGVQKMTADRSARADILDKAKAVTKKLKAYDNEDLPPLTAKDHADYEALRDELRSHFDSLVNLGVKEDALVGNKLFSPYL